MLTLPIGYPPPWGYGIRGRRPAQPTARSGMRVGASVRVRVGLGVGLQPDTQTGILTGPKPQVGTEIRRPVRSDSLPRQTPVPGFPTGAVG